jgi:thymidine phosphorylase
VRTVDSPASGFVSSLSAIAVGTAAVHLGAGRRTKEDAIDHAVGVVLHAKRGDQVAEGEPLAEIHAAADAAAELAAGEVLAAYRIQGEPVRPRPVLLEVIR